MSLLASPDDLPVVIFATRRDLRAWLERHHISSPGVWVQLAKAKVPARTVTFMDLLEEGLCFGWSESKRRKGDSNFFLQRFTPRRTPGTASARNKRLAKRLITEGQMTPGGRKALGW
jgi:uncharacterized protein YdeI (YjbR/CyaY-like superfamily)